MGRLSGDVESARGVFKCENIHSGMVRAVKIYEKDQMDEHHIMKVHYEYELVRGLDHPFIIRYYELYQDMDKIFLIMDHHSNGTINPDSDINSNIKQLLIAINYIHIMSILHRDITVEHILMGEDGCVILSGFNSATKIEVDDFLVEECGEVNYMSPEEVEGSYNEKCDLWSLGVVYFFLLKGELPFSGEDSMQMQGQFELCDNLIDALDQSDE